MFFLYSKKKVPDVKKDEGLGLSKGTLILVHAIFWSVFLGIIFVLFLGFLEPPAAFIRSFFLTVFLIFVYYFNSIVLINMLFERKKYWWYAIGLTTFTVFSLLLKYFLDFDLLAEQSRFLDVAGNKSSRIVSSFPVLFDLVFSTLLQMLLNHYKKLRMYKLRLNELADAQLKLLKGQINPHFLFNNLNNIYSLVLTHSEKAPEMILKLSDLLRYVIYKNTSQKVSLAEEAEQIRNMIALYRLKDDEQKNVVFDDQKVLRQGFIEPMILIPLVENCFKHWDGSHNPGGHIKIVMASDAKWFCFTTENSVPKIPVERPAGEGGLGLENIKKRLDMIYGEKVAFNVQKEKDIFKVKLIIEW